MSGTVEGDGRSKAKVCFNGLSQMGADHEDRPFPIKLRMEDREVSGLCKKNVKNQTDPSQKLKNIV